MSVVKQQRNEFFPAHLRSIAGTIESRACPMPGVPHPFAHIIKAYSIYDLTDRLAHVLRDDPGVCRYLLWCTRQFEERGWITTWPAAERERVYREVVELKVWLAQHERSAIRPARL